VVGSPIANRNPADIEGLIGFFVNTLVLRTDASGNPSFRELLGRARKTALGAYEHQDLPFEKLLEELQPERSLSYSPLFQVMFILQNAPNAGLELPRLSVSPVRPDTETARFDLTLSIHETPSGLSGALQYNTDLFHDATITRMIGHFQILLKGIVADADRRISDLPILTGAEKHQLLVAWNETARDYPKKKCLHQLFEDQVKRTPDSMAAIFEDQQFSYEELNRRANRLAGRLQRLGVGPAVLVGLCVERSLELVVGIMAVLKAGGAYVPLDPSYPRKRLEFMLKDSRASVLMTQKHLFPQLPQTDSAVIYLDLECLKNSSDGAENDANLESDTRPDDLAYVIYTSGSTGQPKGVMITHANVTRLFDSTKAWFEFNGTDVWTLFHSYAFDFSVWEMWGALLNGGKLLIVPHSVSRSPEEFASLIRDHGVTVLNQTPSAFRQLMPQLISTLAPEQAPLRYIIFGGEALELQTLQPWFDRYGDGPTQLVNMYGITETTVHVTYRPITRADTQLGVGNLIGKAIPDLSLYVLDTHQQLQPIGIPGEICVGGAGVARGYLNKAELTAERFIADPFASDPQARLYRSGDLARWLPNGELEYLGRIDDQVKIRGYRIELGEIEAVLGQHPALRESVVLAREDNSGDKRLVAYIAAIPASIPSTNELRSFLLQKLPEYMVPSVWMFLESLPITPSGKLNRQALPAPERTRPELAETFSLPRTPIEELLANIWAEVLKLDKVGIRDNFFDLGGHSLLATQVVARIRSALNVELPLRRLFENPAIHQLATFITAEHQTAQTGQLPPIQPADRAGDLPLSFAQQRLWFIDQLDSENSAYNVPRAWRLSGALDFTALQRSINEIVRRHEVLRTSFITVDGQPIQHIEPSVTLSLDLIHLAELNDSEIESTVELQVREEIQKPFDLARGPLLRAKLLKLSEDDHLLLLTMHHIVSDGWSMGVLFRELSRLYGAFARGNPSPLDNLPIQYADYAVWQRGWLQGDVLESKLPYWRRQLQNLTVLQLPTDRQRPAVQRYRGARARVTFDSALTKKLWALSRDENATLYITLLAAFQILLSRYSGQEDIAVGSPIAGRSISELEGLIGYFLNTLVLRGDLSNNPTFREFLRRMRDVALEAYAHQDVPFEKLVEELAPARDMSRNPLFQVMFVLQNAPDAALALEGMEICSLPLEIYSAKFDLALSVRESAQGFQTNWDYASDLFDAATIKRMARHFERLLEAVVADPDQPIGELPLLTESERNQLLVEWNDTAADYPKDRCIQQLFEAQAACAPNSVAVVFKNKQLTYAELNTRANQLAHYLRKIAVGPDALIGICVERSLEMVIGLLGILKAGAGYVPLDPSHPAERLEFILADAQVSILLTQEGLLERGGSRIDDRDCRSSIFNPLHRICLDRDWELIAKESDTNPESTITPDSLAYVIYTSGSTGKPRGVQITHGSLLDLVFWHLRTFSVTSIDRATQLAGPGFDAAVWELWPCLTVGASVHIPDDMTRLDAAALRDWLVAQAITISFVPTALAERLMTLDWPQQTALRILLTGGDALRVYPPDTLPFRVFNNYGPTECTVVTTSAHIGPSSAPLVPPTIGRPIANSQVYILDAHRNPVPIGTVGEIYIGGDGVARGYLNQPELTAEKFILHSFDDEPPRRLYKTGDLARYLPDGNIEFCGRIDDQVKIRGYRIELGEIEAVLAEHPAVSQAVVMVREDTPGEKRLVAYVVPADSSVSDIDPPRVFLNKRLPNYMRPAAYVLLERLPLTANGKIDRQALPAPRYDQQAGDKFVTPRDVLEESIANVWREVLHLERIGVHDNFFELGGHSLTATQVFARLRRTLRSEIALRDMFEFPTIAEFAEVARILETGSQLKLSPDFLEKT